MNQDDTLEIPDWGVCRDCRAKVQVEQLECDFCGAVRPAQPWRKLLRPDQLFTRVGRWLGGGVGLIFGAGTVTLSAHSAAAGMALAVGGGAVGAFLVGSVGALFGAWLDERLQTGAPKRRTIATMGAWIRQRRAQLTLSLAQIESSKKRVAATVDSGQRDAALEALRHAQAATVKQLRRYEVELWRVDLARWRNRLEPIAATWTTASHDACEAMLPLLLEIVHDAKRMKSRWLQQELSGERGAGLTLAALDDGLTGCEALRQALLVRQAQTLTEGSPGVDEAFAAELAGLPARVQRAHISEQLRALQHEVPSLEEAAEALQAELQAIAAVDREFARDGELN